MKIFIYSPQKEISQIISDHLSCKNSQCIAFETIEDLFNLIHTMKEGPDLLVMDYLSFNHDLFNIFEYLKRIQKQFPVVFYNDPCVTRSSRSIHWKSIIEIIQPKLFAAIGDKLDSVFEKLEELIDSEEFSPYISLLQPPKKVPDSLIKDKYTLQYMKDNADDCITSFKTRNKIPNNLFYLLSLLQKNKDYPMKLSEIIELYKEDGKSIAENSLTVHISRLKNIIRRDKECSFLIVQDKGTYRFVRYKY